LSHKLLFIGQENFCKIKMLRITWFSDFVHHPVF
jgi:hypothetical protein